MKLRMLLGVLLCVLLVNTVTFAQTTSFKLAWDQAETLSAVQAYEYSPPVPAPVPVPSPTPVPAPVPPPVLPSTPTVDYSSLLQQIIGLQGQQLDLERDTNAHVVAMDRTLTQTLGAVAAFVGKYVAPAIISFIAAKKL